MPCGSCFFCSKASVLSVYVSELSFMTLIVR